MSGLVVILLIILAYILLGIRVVNEYERGVRFFLGKYRGIMMPGLQIVLPVLMTWRRVDIRTRTIDVPDQDAITRDNVSIAINAVLYYKVSDPEKAILQVEEYDYAVSQLAQTTMRDVVGEVSLDKLLSERDTVSKKIQSIVDKASDPWGIKVEGVELKHVELPADLKRVIGKEAEAEREKRAVIIKAEGEVVSAQNMAKAANILASGPGALHLRTLQSINDVSSDQSNTIIFAVPLEILRAFEGITKRTKEK